MLLYFSPGACSLAPHIVAREAWLPIDIVKVDLATKTTERGDDYLRINPKGSVPALILDDGTLLTEGAVISQFFADMEPETGLMPAPGTIERYHALEWLNFIATELHKGFSPLWRKDTPAEMREVVKQNIGPKFGYLTGHIEDRDYLLGEVFSAADAYAFTILSWAPVVGIDLAQWPALAAYVERVSVRPGVRAALAAEGLLGAGAA
jgi:glutathione S-transferase